ncbi:Spo0E family sporulation regulatory protein-aspartic acid phosphatase [Neobacillus cucumis]
MKEYQQAMYDLAKAKGLNDPQVLSISQKLDKEIVFFHFFTRLGHI